MSIFLTIFLYFLSGLASGIFGGLGMGGGTLLIPILTIFLGLEQKLSQGINLVAFLVMSLVALFIHFKNGYLNLKGTLLIIISGLTFSLLGSIIAGILPSGVLKKAFGVFLCLLSFYQAFKAFKKPKKEQKSK